MAQNVHLLNNMNLSPETLELAKSIMREATLKTQQGSGFSLRQGAVGLPAICAYLASQRLKTNELTRQTAQVASCLKSADFEKAFRVVEAAISSGNKSKLASYKSLCLKYDANERVLNPLFQQAQRALVIIDDRYSLEQVAEVRYGIFYWVYTLSKSERIQRDAFVKDNHLSYKTFATIVTLLNDKCTSLKAEIIEKAKSRPASPIKPAPNPTRSSPTKRLLRQLPSRDRLTKKRSKSPESPEQPLRETRASQLKLKGLSELQNRPFPETPTKRRKLDDSVLLASGQKPAVSTPLKSILRTSPRKGTTATSTPSRVKLDISKSERETGSDSDTEIDPRPLPALDLARRHANSDNESASDMDADSAEEWDIDDEGASFLSTPNKARTIAKIEPITIRRFRPVYLDYKQWNTLNPHLQVIYGMS